MSDPIAELELRTEEAKAQVYSKARDVVRALRILGMTDAAEAVDALCHAYMDVTASWQFGLYEDARRAAEATRPGVQVAP